MREIADVVSLAKYERQVSVLMGEAERMQLEFFIATTADDHPVIAETGGFRKARWARPGGGKSGGYRVIYYFVADPGIVYMASIYSKSKQENLSAAGKNYLASLSRLIKKERGYLR